MSIRVRPMFDAGPCSVAARSCVLAATLVLATNGIASAEDTARKTNEMLSSVASIASNLELADVPSPIDITADKLEFQYGAGLLRYEGNVVVDHAGARIHARTLDISFEPEGRHKLKKITARGGVEVTRGEESARGELAEYETATGTIVLSQNARLGSGPNYIAGQKVVVYLNERRAIVLGSDAAPAAPAAAGSDKAAAPVTGSGRVRAVLMPDTIEKKETGKK